MPSQPYSLPRVVVSTAYPLHADAFRTHLRGSYEVETVLPTTDLKTLKQHLGTAKVWAVDYTYPYELDHLQTCLPPTPLGLLYLDAHPNIFRVLRYLGGGFQTYLYLGDELSPHLKFILDMTQRRERFLSPTILGLYERYCAYQGLFSHLSPKLAETLRYMGEGLTVQGLQSRLDIPLTAIYRRQYRLRQHFGVDTNRELVEILEWMYQPPATLPPAPRRPI